jgi:hypothetical protein
MCQVAPSLGFSRSSEDEHRRRFVGALLGCGAAVNLTMVYGAQRDVVVDAASVVAAADRRVSATSRTVVAPARLLKPSAIPSRASQRRSGSTHGGAWNVWPPHELNGCSGQRL